MKAAEAALAGEAPGEALEIAEPVGDFVAAHRRSLAGYADAPAEFARLNAAIGKLEPGREGWGADRLELAGQELEKAQQAHADGESAYLSHLGERIRGQDRPALRIARPDDRRRRFGDRPAQPRLHGRDAAAR